MPQSSRTLSSQIMGSTLGIPSSRQCPSLLTVVTAHIQQVHQELKHQLEEAKTAYICHANRYHQLTPNLSFGDKVGLFVEGILGGKKTLERVTIRLCWPGIHKEL